MKMKNNLVKLFVTILLVLQISLYSSSGFSCTTFMVDGSNKNSSDFFLAKSYDWYDEAGMIIVNKKDIMKVAANEGIGNAPLARWKSLYHSITFNQYGHEFPMGGMNSKGLVVEVSWLSDSTYPNENESPLPALNQLQWIQYILDTAKDINEAKSQAQKVRVHALLEANVHWMVCDKSGACASFEYLNKKLVINDMKGEGRFKSLANDTYEDSIKFIKKYKGFGGSKEVPQFSIDSLERFSIATKFSENCKNIKGKFSGKFEASLKKAQCIYGVLDRVVANGLTRWQIVYDIKNLTVFYRTDKVNTIKHLSFKDISSSCNSNVVFLDLNKKGISSRNIAPLMRIKTPQNSLDMLKLNKTLSVMPDLTQTILDYPKNHTVCQ